MPLNKRVIRAPRPEVPPQEKGPVFNGTPEAVLLKTNNLQLSRGTPGCPPGRASGERPPCADVGRAVGPLVCAASAARAPPP